jgi:hypothetical protein
MMTERVENAEQVEAGNPGHAVKIFRPSAGLRLVLTVTFFLLMLFVINAVVGAIWLARNNLTTDAIIFVILFAIGAAMLVFTAIFLMSASHTLVRLEQDKFIGVLPSWRGPTPMFPYFQVEIPYKDIAAVETRSEVYRYYLLPVLVQASSFVRRDGRRFTIGYIRENASEHSLPYDEIAKELAARAGVGVNYRGVVHAGRRIQAMLRDGPSWDAEVISDERAAKLRSAEERAWKYAFIGLAILVGGGILYQSVSLITANVPERPAVTTPTR